MIVLPTGGAKPKFRAIAGKIPAQVQLMAQAAACLLFVFLALGVLGAGTVLWRRIPVESDRLVTLAREWVFQSGERAQPPASAGSLLSLLEMCSKSPQQAKRGKKTRSADGGKGNVASADLNKSILTAGVNAVNSMEDFIRPGASIDLTAAYVDLDGILKSQIIAEGVIVLNCAKAAAPQRRGGGKNPPDCSTISLQMSAGESAAALTIRDMANFSLMTKEAGDVGRPRLVNLGRLRLPDER